MSPKPCISGNMPRHTCKVQPLWMHQQQIEQELRSLQTACRDLADELGLKRLLPGAGRPDAPFSIHDGTRFVFHESSWTVVTLYRMISRYGLSYLWLERAAQRVLTSFLKVYQLQKSGRGFSRPEDLLAELGLYNLTRSTMRLEAQVSLYLFSLNCELACILYFLK